MKIIKKTEDVKDCSTLQVAYAPRFGKSKRRGYEERGERVIYMVDSDVLGRQNLRRFDGPVVRGLGEIGCDDLNLPLTLLMNSQSKRLSTHATLASRILGGGVHSTRHKRFFEDQSKLGIAELGKGVESNERQGAMKEGEERNGRDGGGSGKDFMMGKILILFRLR